VRIPHPLQGFEGGKNSIKVGHPAALVIKFRNSIVRIGSNICSTSSNICTNCQFLVYLHERSTSHCPKFTFGLYSRKTSGKIEKKKKKDARVLAPESCHFSSCSKILCSLSRKVLGFSKDATVASNAGILYLGSLSGFTATKPTFLITKPCPWHVFVLYGRPRRSSGAAFQRILGAGCCVSQ
jgi:hypothetical protein